MVELSGLKARLRAVNAGYPPAMILCLYGNPTYSTIYGIMGPYQNYPYRPKTLAHDQFNKAMSCLHIEIKHEFAIYQNF